MYRKARATIACLLMAAVGCGNLTRGPESVSREHPVPQGDDRPIDPRMWDEPLGEEGVEVGDVTSARLDYAPNAPDSLGEARRIVVTREEAPPVYRQIAWVYQHPLYGRFIVLEEIGDLTQAELEEDASHTPGCSTSPNPEAGPDAYHFECYGAGFSVVSIRDGVRALLVDGSRVRTITWLDKLTLRDPSVTSGMEHPALQVKILGPAEDISTEELILIANHV